MKDLTKSEVNENNTRNERRKEPKYDIRDENENITQQANKKDF